MDDPSKWICKSRWELPFLACLLEDDSFDGNLSLAGARCAQIRGTLSLRLEEHSTTDRAQVKISCGSDWFDKPPLVSSDSYWLQKCEDWHVNKRGELCWVYHEQWRKYMAECVKENGWTPTIRLGTTWLLRSVKFLLCCHSHAHQFGISEWPREWEAYSHFDKAKPEFARDERRRQRRKARR